MFVLLNFLFLKHFVCEFVLQTDTMIQSKSRYGSAPGMLHSLQHAIGTMLVLLVVIGDPVISFIFGILDGLVHYHIDYIKVRISQGLTIQDKWFWIWFGLDQYLHYITYIVIIQLMLML